jgi:hypothetical protein
MDKFADFVIGNNKKLLIGVGAATLALISFVPTLEFNDQWVEYFDERIEFRRDSDRTMEHFGLYPIEYSVPSTGAGGVSEPEYLENIESFAEYLRAQPIVTHVYALSDIMKRLNRNMHGDDTAWHRIPADRELSAQYLLLYELSLPYGLDLNDRIKSRLPASPRPCHAARPRKPGHSSTMSPRGRGPTGPPTCTQSRPAPRSCSPTSASATWKTWSPAPSDHDVRAAKHAAGTAEPGAEWPAYPDHFRRLGAFSRHRRLLGRDRGLDLARHHRRRQRALPVEVRART